MRWWRSYTSCRSHSTLAVLRPVMTTERIACWEIPSPVGKDLGQGGDRNTRSRIWGVRLLLFLLLITCTAREISSLWWMLVIPALDFIVCFTGIGVWRPGLLYLNSAIDFPNNAGKLYRPSFSVWHPEVQHMTPWSPQQQTPPTTYKAHLVNWEAGLSSASLCFLNIYEQHYPSARSFQRLCLQRLTKNNKCRDRGVTEKRVR